MVGPQLPAQPGLRRSSAESSEPRGTSSAGFLRRNGAFLALAAVMLSPGFLTSDTYYLSILAFMAIRLMTMSGLNLLMGQAGQVSLGHGAFVGMGAYGSAILTTRWGVDPWGAMVVAALISGLVALVVGVPSLKLRGHYLAMATLGFGEIVFILLIQLKGLTNGTDGITGIPPLALGPVDFADPQAFHLLVWLVALAIFRMALNLPRSRVGRSLRALHRAEVAASSLGVEVARRKVEIFVVSGIFGSIAGSFLAHYVMFISPDTFSLTFSILLVTGVVIGGLGSVWGAFWGTAVMVLLPEVLQRYNEDSTLLVFGVLVILIMIFLPGGLASAPEAVSRRLAESRRGRSDTSRSEGEAGEEEACRS